jgi:hypothetical protein
VRQFQRHANVLGDNGRAEASAEAEKEHAARLVATDRLHECVVYHPHWPFKRGFEIEIFSSRPKVKWIGGGPVGDNRSGISHRDKVVVPVFRELAQCRYHLGRCHLMAGFDRAPFAAAAEFNLHM